MIPADQDPRRRYAGIYQRLLDALPETVFATENEPGTAHGRASQPSRARIQVAPLGNVNPQAQHDFALALISGWAMVSDILRFYNERIARESYRSTAREPRSILWMAHSLGYQRWHGNAAGTWLALTVSAKTIPQLKTRSGIVEVKPGGNLVVQSVPPQGSMPVVFEVDGAVEARVEWNRMAPAVPTSSQLPVVFAGMVGLRLNGAVTSLRVGSSLLLATAAAQYFRTLATVDLQRTAGYTVVTWLDPIEIAEPSESGILLGVYTFRQQAGLFGRRAAAWSSASAATRSAAGGTPASGLFTLDAGSSHWSSIQGSLPGVAIRALAAFESEGMLYAATATGLYGTAAPESGSGWQVLTTTPAQQDVQSLHVDQRGFLYAGGTRGAISFSSDRGETWQSLRAPVAPPSPTECKPVTRFSKLRAFFTEPPVDDQATTPTTAPSIPFDGVIRALTGGIFADGDRLLAGTDRGVFLMSPGAVEWHTWSCGLPGYSDTSGLCGTVVHALLKSPQTGDVFAGTDTGLYLRGHAQPSWQPQPLPVPYPTPVRPTPVRPTPQPAILSLAWQGNILFAGTSAGLYAHTAPWDWARVPGTDAPPPEPIVALAAQGSTVLAATAATVYRSLDSGTTWEKLDRQRVVLFPLQLQFQHDLDDLKVSELLSGVFAANSIAVPAQTAIERLPDGTWKILGYRIERRDSAFAVLEDVTLGATPVQALALDAHGRAFLATAFTAAYRQPDWPGFQLEGTSIPLDRVVSDVSPDSFVVLEQTYPAPLAVVSTVKTVEQSPVQAFGRQATVSVLTVETSDPRLTLLSPRNTTVNLRAVALSVYAPDEPILTPLEGATLTLAGALDSLRPGLQVAITGLRPSAILPSVGGVFQLTGDAGTSSPSAPNPLGLEQENVLALIAGAGKLWAIVEGAGVFSRSAPAPTQRPPLVSSEADWKYLRGDQAPNHPTCLAFVGDTLWAGTLDRGAVCWTPKDQWRVDPHAPRAITAFTSDRHDNLYAGTLSGEVWARPNTLKRWEEFQKIPQSTDVPCPIRALAFGNGSLFAATAGGVYEFSKPGAPPTRVAGEALPRPNPHSNQSTPATAGSAPDVIHVTALAFDRNVLHAGTAAGAVFRRSPASDEWYPVQADNLPQAIQAFAFPAGTLVVATAGAGIYRWQDAHWRQIFGSVSNDVTALLVDASAGLYAATRNLALLAGNAAHPVRVVRHLLFQAPPAVAGELDLQAISPLLTLLFQQNGITLGKLTVKVLLRGRHWLIRSGAVSYLAYLRSDGLAGPAICVVLADTLSAISKKVLPERPTRAKWKLAGDAGTGVLILTPEEILTGPGLPGDTVAEVLALENAAVGPAGDTTLCTFAQPLSHLYDPESTTLTANLAYATHGATVPLEVLGSGNANLPNQSFTLQRPPLTYIDEGSVSTLQVHVTANARPTPPPAIINPLPVTPAPQGTPWTQLPTLFGAAPDAQVYSVSTGADGKTTLLFGDGIEGARLPSGTGNLTAQYRSGLGPQGNVAPNTLAVFRKRPLGLSAVTNPLPAQGGSNPETVPSIHRRMNLFTRALDRIVSLSDYADFCLAEPNVLKAKMTVLKPSPTLRRLHLTLALEDRLPVDDSPIAMRALRTAIASARAGQEPFELAGYVTRHFRLQATLHPTPGADVSAVLESAFATLKAAFSLIRRDFAQEVTRLELEVVLQSVPLVAGVEIDALYFADTLPSNQTCLPALDARLGDDEQSLPAQLLLLDPSATMLDTLTAAPAVSS